MCLAFSTQADAIIQPLVKSVFSTVIVIDILDECRDTKPASTILFVLGQFVAKISNLKVKFFVAGRPEPCIQDGFQDRSFTKAIDVFVLHEIQPRQVNSDVRLLFTHNFLELKGPRGGLDDWLTGEQLNLLCECAAGLFVYPVATIGFIYQANNNPMKQLSRLLQSLESVLVGNTKLTEGSTLDPLYMSILQFFALISIRPLASDVPSFPFECLISSFTAEGKPANQ